MSVTVSVDVHLGYVNADVDLGDIDTEDLLDELRSRNRGIAEDSTDDVVEMFYAFKLDQTGRAMELAKKIAQDHTGRIL